MKIVTEPNKSIIRAATEYRGLVFCYCWYCALISLTSADVEWSIDEFSEQALSHINKHTTTSVMDMHVRSILFC